MDPQVQGSFIPKQALTATSRGGGMGLFLLLALLVFVMSLVAAGGAFGYQQFLNKSLADKDESLRRAEGAFDAGSIQDLVRMDDRIDQAKVQFSDFDFDLLSNGGATIALSGSADSFSSVALQSDQLGGSKVLKDVIFSGITVADGGRVNFSVNASVDPQLISYSRNLTQGEAAPQP